MLAPHLTRRCLLETAAGFWAACLMGAERAVAAGDRKPIRVGVIGVGNRCRAHINVIKGLPERCRIVAACDIIPERVEGGAKLAGGEGVRTFSRHTDLLAARLCDAVVITTPNYAHKEIAIDALAAGCHVLCEKPMATTPADADAMVAAAEKSRRVFAVGLQFRYAPVYLKVRELLQGGAIGQIKYVWAQEFRGDWHRLYADPEENARKNWRYFQKLSGGTLVEKNCHDFDILSWLIDSKPVRVAATGGTTVYTGRDTLDHASVAVDYASGAKLTLGLCLFAKAPQSQTAFVGTTGTLEFPRGGTSIVLRKGGKREDQFDLHDAAATRLDDRGVNAMYGSFLDAIAGGPAVRNNARVGRESLTIPFAAEQAVREHKVIEL